MADLPHRSAHEAALAEALGRLGASRRRKLLALLGDPPDLQRVPPEFWASVELETEQALAERLAVVYLLMSQGLRLPEAVLPRATLAQDAAVWGRQEAQLIATDYAGTSRDWVADIVSTPGATPLRERLTSVFGPTRAEGLATTQTTRAATAGERGALDRWERVTGAVSTATWQTELDGAVCPICRPLQGTEELWREKVPAGPPAHPRCRCWLQWQIGAGEEF